MADALKMTIARPLLAADRSPTYVMLMASTLASYEGEHPKLVNSLDNKSTGCKLEISAESTKIMSNTNDGFTNDIKVNPVCTLKTGYI